MQGDGSVGRSALRGRGVHDEAGARELARKQERATEGLKGALLPATAAAAMGCRVPRGRTTASPRWQSAPSVRSSLTRAVRDRHVRRKRWRGLRGCLAQERAARSHRPHCRTFIGACARGTPRRASRGPGSPRGFRVRGLSGRVFPREREECADLSGGEVASGRRELALLPAIRRQVAMSIRPPCRCSAAVAG